MVPRSCSPRRCRARSMTSRTSLTPADTADNCSKWRLVVPATANASVVLPVPGGPQKMAELSRSCSTSRRSGRPGPTRCACPTTSSSVRGRKRAASGACWRSRSAAAELNRSSLTTSSAPTDSQRAGNRPRSQSATHGSPTATRRIRDCLAWARCRRAARRTRTSDAAAQGDPWLS